MNATRIGIDVSKWQRDIEWERVKQDPKDIQFAYVRSHYGTVLDPKALDNIAGARAVGLDVGVYQYMRCAEDIGDQWWTLREFLTSLETRGIELQLPPVLDVEIDDLWTPHAPHEIATNVFAWLLDTHDVFGGSMIYTNRTSGVFFEGVEDWNCIASTYPLWVAHWGVHTPTLPQGFTEYRMHQYSSKGTVEGIYGHVDLNVELLQTQTEDQSCQ